MPLRKVYIIAFIDIQKMSVIIYFSCYRKDPIRIDL